MHPPQRPTTVVLLAALAAPMTTAGQWEPGFGLWAPQRGKWSETRGVFAQTTTDPGCLALAPPADWTDYTLQVKARKTRGAEGFLILFRVQDDAHFYWWNIAGWRNKQHAVETRPKRVMDPKRGSIETRRWYDVKVEVRGNLIRCYLDGKLIHGIEDDTYLSGGIGLGSWRTAVEYRDVRVTAPDGTDLLAPLLAETRARRKAAEPPFVVRETWPETMLATRQAWQQRRRDEAARMAQLRIAGLRLSGWRYSEGVQTGTLDAALGGTMPPEESIKAGTPVPRPLRWRGRIINWRGPKRDWRWTDGTTMVCRRPQDAPANAVNFVHRTITSPGERAVKGHFGADEGIVVWLNGQRVLAATAKRRCRPNQFTATLPLKEGMNQLLIKLPHKRRGFRFYFSLDSRPGDRRLDTLRAQIWTKLHNAFPQQTDQLQGRLLAKRSKQNWLEATDTRVEQTLIAEALANGHVGASADTLQAQLSALVERDATASDPAWLALFERVCNAQREAALERCPPVAFIKREAGGRKGTNGTMLGQRTKQGSKICVYDPARPEAGARVIFDAPKGFVFDMSPSFDGRKLVFSFMDYTPAQNDSFHIWEINTNGTGLRQLTRGPWHDGSPAYLPNARVVFCSTRVESFSLCQNYLAAALYTMEADGSNIRRLEYNTLCDTTPWVMDDGSILFGRWEYQDKNIFCVQGLWTINPNGSRVQLFYGNTLNVPNSQYGAKQIPGTSKVISVLAPHHGRPLGAIAITDRTKGLESPEATVNITREIPYFPKRAKNWRDGFTWGPGDVQYHWAYTDPWPIEADLFLCAYGGPVNGGPKRYRLYLLNDRGEKFLLYDDPSISCYCPVSLRPRPLPHKPSGRAPGLKGYGAFFVQDVYQGLLDAGVKRGDVTSIRVMTQLPKKYNTEGPRYYDHYPAIGHGSYYPKACLGEAPVDANGCAYFRVPAGIEVYFQAIDATGKEVRRMGTVTQTTQGETQGCIGCHESRFRTPMPKSHVMKRLARGPDRLRGPEWMVRNVSFVGLVQPVLDRYCVNCHSGRAPKARLDLSGDKTRLFNMAYEGLTRRKLVDHYWINRGPTGNFPPLKSGSRVSKLTEIIETDHGKVDLGAVVDDESRRRIYLWIDTNAPYYGTWDMARPHTMGGRDTWAKERSVKAEWYARFEKVYNTNCVSCHARDGNFGELFPCSLNSWINLTRPEFSRVLNAHLSKEAGGMGLSKPMRGKRPPVFRDTNDPTYRAILEAIRAGEAALDAKPRMDMPRGVPIAQQRNFGKLY